MQDEENLATTTPSGRAAEARSTYDTADEHVRAYVSRLWAADWDSAEDSSYDDL